MDRGLFLKSDRKADCNVAQDYFFYIFFNELMNQNLTNVCKISVVSGSQHSIFVHTSKLWGSSLYGSHTSFHSVAHPLEWNETANTDQGQISLPTSFPFL